MAFEKKQIVEKDNINGNVQTISYNMRSIREDEILYRKAFIFDSEENLRPLKRIKNDIILPAFFTDNMVLQRNEPVEIWGKANANANVTVDFAGQTLNAVSDENGDWSVVLDSMKPVHKAEVCPLLQRLSRK